MSCFHSCPIAAFQKVKQKKGVSIYLLQYPFYRRNSVAFSRSHSEWSVTRILSLVAFSSSYRKTNHHKSSLHLHKYLSNSYHVADIISLLTSPSSSSAPSQFHPADFVTKIFFQHCLPSQPMAFLVQVTHLLLTNYRCFIICSHGPFASTISKVICLWFLFN